MNSTIQKIVGSKNIALLGASPSGKKFGNGIFKSLTSRGYNVFLVHPTTATIEGTQTYSDINDLPEEVNTVIFCLSPDKAEGIIKENDLRNIKHIWFQQGADFTGAENAAKDKGIETVSNKCILMYAEPVRGIHKFHRTLAKLFHKL